MDILISRQPIFDAANGIAGYDISYHGQGDGDDAGEPGGDPTRQFMVDTFLGVGLDQLAMGKPAFVDAPRELLVDESIDLLDPARAVIKLPRVSDGDDGVLAAAQRLSAGGFRLALLASDAERAPAILELSSVLRFDVQAHNAKQLERAVERARRPGLRLLAEGVEHSGEHERCLDLGFELFEGYGFARPEVVTHRELPVNQLRIIELLHDVQDLDRTDLELEESFRSDLGLSYKLLRMVNSAAAGRRDIESIAHAVRLLGRDALYRWVAMLLVGSLSRTGVMAEVAHTALVRARLCELLAIAMGRRQDAGAFYMAGLISVLDILLGQPMYALTPTLRLRSDVEAALLEREGVHGVVLRLVEAYDLGHFDEAVARCAELGLSADVVAKNYLAALAWAGERAFLTEGE